MQIIWRQELRLRLARYYNTFAPNILRGPLAAKLFYHFLEFFISAFFVFLAFRILIHIYFCTILIHLS